MFPNSLESNLTQNDEKRQLLLCAIIGGGIYAFGINFNFPRSRLY